MSKHLLLFILILAVCTNVFAQQTKSISGVVYDSNTGEALIGVSVLKPTYENETLFDDTFNVYLPSKSVIVPLVVPTSRTEIVNEQIAKRTM